LKSRLGAEDLLYYVGTHHKAGTTWMRQLHGSIGRQLGLPVTRLTRTTDLEDPAKFNSTVRSIRARSGIVLDEHSCFSEVPKQIGMRGVHIIRDPRDVLISSAFYHLTAPEGWLHRPLPQYDDMTYQEKLRSLGTIRKALLLELKSLQMRIILDEMQAFPKLATVPTTTYESLMAGDVLAAFEAMFSSLGFSGHAKQVALECARQESIVLNPRRRRSHHVRSGEPQQWRQQFDQELGEQFVAVSGDDLVALGYEPDHSWLKDLPPARPSLDGPLPVGEARDSTALNRRYLDFALKAADDLSKVPLEEGLEICGVLAATRDDRFRAASRQWLARYGAETSPNLNKLVMAGAAMAELGEHPESEVARDTLGQLLEP
jgi:hypothetical protein